VHPGSQCVFVTGRGRGVGVLAPAFRGTMRAQQTAEDAEEMEQRRLVEAEEQLQREEQLQQEQRRQGDSQQARMREQVRRERQAEPRRAGLRWAAFEDSGSDVSAASGEASESRGEGYDSDEAEQRERVPARHVDSPPY